MDDPVALTIRSYETKAMEYIENTRSLATYPSLASLLEQFISRLPGPRILDAGFGSGRDMIYLRDRGIQVFGVELTEAFITELKKRADFPLCKMDMRYLAFGDGTFDGIWCCASFLHLPRTDALATLQGFQRVLRPTGILYMDVKEGYGHEWKSNNDGNISNAIRYFTYYEESDIKGFLRRAAFELEVSRAQEGIKLDRPRWLQFICRKQDRGTNLGSRYTA